MGGWGTRMGCMRAIKDADIHAGVRRVTLMKTDVVLVLSTCAQVTFLGYEDVNYAFGCAGVAKAVGLYILIVYHRADRR
jgi:hypothetical protein